MNCHVILRHEKHRHAMRESEAPSEQTGPQQARTQGANA